jgi:Transposase IS200 like.
MRGRLSFREGAIQHIYQNTINGYLIFYSVRDCLVFFTVFATVARRFSVRILGVCLMADHIHILVEARCKKDLDQMVCLYTSWFSRQYNEWYGLDGPLFRGPYGIASKVTDQKIRDAIAYLYNNPVERQLCKRAEQAHWNFLAYAENPYPFSQPIRLDKARAPMRRAVEEVRATRKEDRPLNYAQLKRITAKLNSVEQQQLTDFIITAYNCVDYPDLFYRFDDYTSLITAIHTTTGSEYAIKEVFVGQSDKIYKQMTEFLLQSHRLGHIEELLRLPLEERLELVTPLNIRTGAWQRQIEKYLHLPPDKQG